MAKTRKNKNNSTKKVSVMTVPQLRRAFEQIDVETNKILRAHPINEDSVKEFQKAWKRVFHKSVDSTTAQSYLELQSKQSRSGGKLRKTRKQKGGVAPVDYTLRPGIDGTHGNYLPYVSSGLSFYNNINQIAMDQDCGKIDITPKVDVSMGSNEFMKGGSGRIIPSTVPPTVLQDAQDYYYGRPLGSSPSVLNTNKA